VVQLVEPIDDVDHEALHLFREAGLLDEPIGDVPTNRAARIAAGRQPTPCVDVDRRERLFWWFGQKPGWQRLLLLS